MNGRVFDPRTGRFVQPDPVVGNPSVGESYNRYAYVRNSPLSATGPTGFTGEPREDGGIDITFTVWFGFGGYGGYSSLPHRPSRHPTGGGTRTGALENLPNVIGAVWDIYACVRFNICWDGNLPSIPGLPGSGGFGTGYCGEFGGPYCFSLDNRSSQTGAPSQSGYTIGDGVLDGVQIVVGIVGMVPAWGNLADGVNASISAGRGDFAGATLDGLSAIPGSGQATAAVVLSARGSRIASLFVRATAKNYRSRFLAARPDLPSDWPVHHSIPQRYEEIFDAAGINVHETQLLRGVSPQLHSRITTEWGRFHARHGGDPTAAQVAEFAREIDQRFGGSFVWPGF